jgi:superfamily II DNA or RNA helicase
LLACRFEWASFRRDLQAGGGLKFTNNMKIEITNTLRLSDMPENIQTAICEKLTMSNPKWHENEKMGRWNGETPRLLRFYEKTAAGLVIPRGYARQLLWLCKNSGISYEIVDQRRSLPEVDFTFNGQLKPFQQTAVNAMLQKDFGTLSAPTGSGKTVMALSMIAERKQPCLIMVHTKELLNQWIGRIETFLGIPNDQVGIIGDGKKIMGARITVALVQSLYKCAGFVSDHIGHLVIDECHRAPSRTFTEAVTAFDCKYMVGLSATPWRRDRLSRLIFWHIGDVHHEVDKANLVETGDILKAEVITRETDFRPWCDPSQEYTKMLNELTRDEHRNLLISSDVANEAKNGSGVCLVLSDRKAHCETLQTLLDYNFGIPSELLTGDVPAKQRQDIVDRLNQGKVNVLIATGQLIGEGFDCRSLKTLFMATPIKFNGRVIQYLGRVLRPAPGKDRARVYDYIDARVPVLVASAKARRRVYGI